MAHIIGLFGDRARQARRDWTNQDLAELYRVESALIQAGVRIETERGRSDEGDPWFVFCHGETGDIVVHFARIDGLYVVAAPILAKPLTGPDLGTIVKMFVADHPVTIPTIDNAKRNNVILHPAVLLTAFVATILLMSSPGETLAAELHEKIHEGPAGPDHGDDDHVAHSMVAGALPVEAGAQAAQAEAGDPHRPGENTLVLAAIALAVEVARAQSQDAPDFHSPDLGLDTDALAAAKEAGHESDGLRFLADLFGLSGEAQYGPADYAPVQDAALKADDDDHLIAGVKLPSAEASFVAISAPAQPVDEVAPPPPEEWHALQKDIVAPVAEPAPPAAGEPVVAEASSVAEPAPEATDPGESLLGAASLWFSQFLSDGALVALAEVNPDHADEIALAIEVVDNAPLIEVSSSPESSAAAEMLPETTSYGTAEVSEPTFVSVDEQKAAALEVTNKVTPMSSGVLVLDEAAKRAIDHFLHSDTDITDAYRGDGSIILFDRSDLAAGDFDLRSWVFGDHTMITIIGRADTLMEAIHLA